MKFIALVLFLSLLGSSQVQTKEINAASSKCPAPKQLARNDDGFAVQLNQPNIVYIYVAESNSFLVLNAELNHFVILDGTNKTFFGCDASNGYAGMFNPNTDLIYAVVEKQNPFNLSKVLNGDFSVATHLIQYASLFTDKVIGSNIVTTDPEYSKISTLIDDYAKTFDYAKWRSYKEGTNVNTKLQKTKKIQHVLNNVLYQHNNKYTVEWGAILFYVVASEEYKNEEECQTAFIDVPMNLARKHDYGFTPEEMNKLFNVVSEQKEMTKKEAIQQYEAITKME